MRVLLTGASGQLGSYILDALIDLNVDVIAWSGTASGVRRGISLQPIDLTDRAVVSEAIGGAAPDVVIHTAAMSSVEAVSRDPKRGTEINVNGTRNLADWCRRNDRRLIYTSTDMVFDGTVGWYAENDRTNPIVAYGTTKLLGEELVSATRSGLVVRLSLLFGPSRSRRPTTYDRSMEALRAGIPQTYFEDEFRTPLDFATAAQVLVQLALGGNRGIVHLGGRERVSRFELIRRVAEALDINTSLVKPNRREDVPAAGPRPRDLSLDTTLMSRMVPDLELPSIEVAVRRMEPS